MYNADVAGTDTTLAGWPASSGRLDRLPLASRARWWSGWIGPAISLAIVAAVLAQIDSLNLGRVWRLVPETPGFWLVFAACYMVGPVAEWVIFRRLWNLPAGGLLALMRKMVGNEILLGYSGEVYFYGWARRHSEITAAPFGAVKDVAILSAAVGNVVTLVVLAAAWPLLGSLHLGMSGRVVLWSAAIVVATSLAAMLFRRRLFSLPRHDLVFISALHFIRTILKSVLAAALWHIVMPAVPIHWWLMLSALRMVVSRLPFLPNKDLVFAGLAVFLIGRDTELSDLMAMTASLILATHMVVGGTLGVAELANLGGRR